MQAQVQCHQHSIRAMQFGENVNNASINVHILCEEKSAHSSCLVFTTNIQDMCKRASVWKMNFCYPCAYLYAYGSAKPLFTLVQVLLCLQLLTFNSACAFFTHESHAKITEELPHSSIPANSTKQC